MARAIVIYDADCGFCKWSLALLLAWDGSRRKHGRPSPPNWQLRWGRSAVHGALRPVPLGSGEADELLADLTVEERDASWHLVVDGARFSAGAALAPALAPLCGGRIPAALFRRFPAATELGYRWVADHRGPLGRLVSGRARRWAERTIAAHGVAPQ